MPHCSDSRRTCCSVNELNRIGSEAGILRWEARMSNGFLTQIIGVFVREANQRLAEMTQILAAMRDGESSALHDLMRRFHSFAGIGGIDGFDVINSLAARGERECRRMLKEGEQPSAEHMRRWSSMCDVLRGEVDELERSCSVVQPMPQRERRRVFTKAETGARILSVEDDSDQALYLRSVLEGDGYEVRTCADPNQFKTDLVDFRPDLILMDILLPSVSGYELARFARSLDGHQTTPILFLTADGQQQTRIESMRSGGDDHIQKPVSPTLLLATVQTRLERARQLRHVLDRDSLTGLLNRAAFHRELQAWVRESGGEGAIVMIDVDRFKQLNDTHGHAFGDSVLARLGAFLTANVRASDRVCRYGGEEFTLLLDGVSHDEALRLVDRLRDEFASTPQLSPDGKSVCVSFSSGVAPMPSTIAGLAGALAGADAALYRAKAAGRNCVFFNDERKTA
jgi:diguanylate cyclase (GGDEF)-like protein